jgi:O-antigen ligase
MLGENALFVLLAGLALILCGALRSLFLLLVIFSGMAMAALSLALAQSVTPTIVLPVSSGLLLLLCFRKIDSRLVALCAVVAFVALAVGPFCLAVLGIDPVEELLAAFGKNSTLTGRTKIWDIGFQVLRDYWVLGVGFLSFWRAAEFSSYATVIQAIGGENVRAFHDFLLEIWIGTGLPGLITMLVLLGAALSRTWRAYRATGSVSAAFSFVIIITAIVLGLPGAGLYRQHESLMMFVVMFGVSAMVSGMRPEVPRRVAESSLHSKE